MGLVEIGVEENAISLRSSYAFSKCEVFRVENSQIIGIIILSAVLSDSLNGSISLEYDSLMIIVNFASVVPKLCKFLFYFHDF